MGSVLSVLMSLTYLNIVFIVFILFQLCTTEEVGRSCAKHVLICSWAAKLDALEKGFSVTIKHPRRSKKKMHALTNKRSTKKTPLNSAFFQEIRKVMYYPCMAKHIYVLGLMLGYVTLCREKYMMFGTKRSTEKGFHIMISVLKCISLLLHFVVDIKKSWTKGLISGKTQIKPLLT